MAVALFLLFLSLLLFLTHAKNLAWRSPRANLPPGPPPLPLVGNLLDLGSLPHRSLRRLSEIYGPLMHLKLGQIPTLVVSSSDIAIEILKTQDLTFCTRPPLSSLRKMYYGGLNIAFTPFNAYLKQVRKICTSNLLGSSRAQSFRHIREEEVDVLMKAITYRSSSSSSNSSTTTTLVNLSEMFLCLLNNITCRELLGKRFAGDGECGRSRFHDLVTEWTHLMGHFNVGEFFPSFEWINSLTGLRGKFEKNFSKIDGLLDEIVDEHLLSRKNGVELDQENITSVILDLYNDQNGEISLSRNHVKAILMDLFIAGTDTGAVALEWGMSELMKNPRVRRKAQEEIRLAMGGKHKVEEDDLHKLSYLKLVLKEIFRLHPPAPFLLPRMSRQECVVGGYRVEAGTRVTVNVWAIHRDPATWEKTEEFVPERFANSSIDYKGQNFELIPFGSGRRGCPGIAMGAVVVELALANLLHGFDWCLPEGVVEDEMDMDESFGIVIRRKSPLLLAAVPHVKV